MALNVIIIAAIGLLVLVVVLFIFGGKANVFSKGVSDCEALGGECSDIKCYDLTPQRPAISNGNCEAPEGEKRYCCSKAIS